MKIKLKRILKNGLTWRSEFLGKEIFTPFPTNWISKFGLESSELCDIYEVQEQIIETEDAGFISKDKLPSDFKIKKDWTTIKRFVPNKK